jgi:hypothetical protein
MVLYWLKINVHCGVMDISRWVQLKLTGRKLLESSIAEFTDVKQNIRQFLGQFSFLWAVAFGDIFSVLDGHAINV